METLVNGDCRTSDRESRLRAALLSPDDLIRLGEECVTLLSFADRLEALSTDIHMNYRADEAQLLVYKLRQTIPAHLEKEAAIMDTVDAADDPSIVAVIDRTREEHAAMRALIVPVLRGLRSIGKDRLPTRLAGFVMATGILCEFLRMHAHFKQKELYPLLGQRRAR